MPRPAENLKLEQRIEIARRFAAGESAKALSEIYGVSPRHVNRLAKEEIGEGVAVRDPSEIVAFRASQSELTAFDKEWQSRGFSNRSQALNALLRGRCGFLDVPRDLVVEFCEIWRQAQDVSDAGRVLAKAVHRGKLVLSEGNLSTLTSLLDVAQKMSRELGSMKEAARNQRGQGWNAVDEPLSESPEETRDQQSDLKLHPQSLPLAGARTQLATHDSADERRSAVHG
ncbi:helix-turn-helix domain-containing protein [uncultured Roseovarius sp.]|uniref:helix-turn-helix domain-containing protein n=1 Tax=uncultured Roseovarius sp. TaxID=293344 RepID=UPI002603D228|nr:helix-turn-helix domain-containing protein [uncultured Roseovarius sp.]